jgi:outer membrane protein assembly factor BamB
MAFVRVFIGIGVTIALTAGLAAQAPSGDWPQWRGPNRDGVASAFKAPQAWPERLTQRWKVEVGLGYATPLVVGNRVYVFAREGDNEVMSALDPDTGRVLWKSAGYPVTFEMQSATRTHGPGPKATPVFLDGRLYTVGMTGIVTAYDAATGKQLWQNRGTGALPMFTTHSFSPLIDRGLLIVHRGGHDDGELAAFDINTGDVRWRWNGDGPGYGSPVIAEFGATRQVIAITQKLLVGVDAATGALLWERPFASPNNTNSVTPLVHGELVIVSSNGPPTTAVRVGRRNNQWMTETVWENDEVPLRMTSPVAAADMIMGLSTRNSGHYFAVDAKTGKTLWASDGRQANNAALAVSGQHLLSLEDDGELVVMRVDRSGFEPVRRYKVADADTWTQAAYSGNRIFVKDVTSLTLWTVN